MKLGSSLIRYQSEKSYHCHRQPVLHWEAKEIGEKKKKEKKRKETENIWEEYNESKKEIYRIGRNEDCTHKSWSDSRKEVRQKWERTREVACGGLLKVTAKGKKEVKRDGPYVLRTGNSKALQEHNEGGGRNRVYSSLSKRRDRGRKK